MVPSAWQQSHTHKSGSETREGTSELVPWGGTSLRHWKCSIAEQACARATYGTWREPSRLCRGCCRPAKAKALPRNRSAEPPPSLAPGLAVLQKLAAERRRPSPRGVLGERWAVLRHHRKPSPSGFLFSPHPLRVPVRPGSEQQGGRSLPLPSARFLPLALRTSEMPGGRIQTQKKREGGAEEGTPTPPSPSQGEKKKITRGLGGKSEERRLQKKGARQRRRCWCCHCRRASAPPAAGQRDSEGFPIACQLTWRDYVRAEHAAPPADGRTHGLSAARRGAASPRLCSSSSSGRGRIAGDAAAPPPAAPEEPGGGRGGEALPPLPFSSPHPGSSFAASSSSLPYPSGCQNPSALPSPRWEAEGRRDPRARVHQLGRGPRKEASASPRAGGGAEVGYSQCDLGTRLQPWLPPAQLQETEPLGSDAFSLPSLLPFRQRWYRLRELRPPGNQNSASDRQVFRVVLTSSDGAEHPDWSLEPRGLQTRLMQMFSICN